MSRHPGQPTDDEQDSAAAAFCGNDDFAITDADVRKASSGYEVLGPAYFASQRIAERLMAGADAQPLRAVADKCTEDIQDAVYEYIESHLLGDLELNLASYITRNVESTVEALLTGQEWAMRQYPFTDYQRGESIRAAVAKHGGEPLLMARISDLEKEIARLRESLEWARR